MFRFLTAGESHGQCLTAIIEGIPAGLPVDVEAINKDLARRQQGYGRGGRMKIETDKVEILSGVRFGETMGDPITLKVANKDWENWTERMSVSGQPAGPAVTAARPGHADLIGCQKYDRTDIRDILERASARETAARVAVGAMAKQLLAACNIDIVSHGADEDMLDVAWVPGAFEIPMAAKKMAESKKYDAVICLGAVIRGSTSHYDYVCNEVSKGVAQVGMSSGIPMASESLPPLLLMISTYLGITEDAPCRTIGKFGRRFSISSRISKRSFGF